MTEEVHTIATGITTIMTTLQEAHASQTKLLGDLCGVISDQKNTLNAIAMAMTQVRSHLLPTQPHHPLQGHPWVGALGVGGEGEVAQHSLLLTW